NVCSANIFYLTIPTRGSSDLCVPVKDFDPASARHTVNRWIAGETERAAKAVTAALEAYKFNEAATAIYDFTWGVFCDWYLELVKDRKSTRLNSSHVKISYSVF